MLLFNHRLNLSLKKTLLLISIIYNAFSLKENEIIIPFKILSSPLSTNMAKERNTTESYNSSTFFNDYYIFRFFSEMEIGTPPKKIVSYINIYSSNSKIGDLKYLYSGKYGNLYKSNESSSFINISSINEKESICEENINLFANFKDYMENKSNLFSNFCFQIDNNINDINSSGLNIGLSLDDNNSTTNFMRQLYERKIITSYILSFEYIDNDKGMIILGNLPHNYLPEKYTEENFQSFYSNQPRNMLITNFFISFDEIFSANNSGKIKISEKVSGNIVLNSGLIVGTNEYFKFIENNFFDEYVKLNICQKNNTNIVLNDYIIFSCNENENLKFEKFPNLTFVKKLENLTFEFTYKDLFKKIGKRYYFLITFLPKGINKYWRIGNPFFIKYTFVYNGDSKTIGFYTYKKINKSKDKNINQKNDKLEIEISLIIIISILILLFVIFAISIGFYCGKKLNSNRKKHANELDDNYEYYSSDEKRIN